MNMQNLDFIPTSDINEIDRRLAELAEEKAVLQALIKTKIEAGEDADVLAIRLGHIEMEIDRINKARRLL